MELSEDYKDLFRILNKYKVKYLLIGAYAVIYYTEPRYTKDIDISVSADIKNAEKVYDALKKFGAPLKGIKPVDFTDKTMVYQIGVAPVRIDILPGIKAINFESAWKKRKRIKFDDIPVNIIDKKNLTKIKKALKRPQDILDLEKLKSLK